MFCFSFLKFALEFNPFCTSLSLFFLFLQAAVLHDTVEDTQTTLDELEEHFGEEVRSLVNEVSDDKSLPKQERKRLQARRI